MGIGEGENIHTLSLVAGHRSRRQNPIAKHECNSKHLTGLHQKVTMCLFDCHKYRADISDHCSLAQHAINNPES